MKSIELINLGRYQQYRYVAIVGERRFGLSRPDKTKGWCATCLAPDTISRIHAYAPTRHLAVLAADKLCDKWEEFRNA